jgi:hypothetical protein
MARQIYYLRVTLADTEPAVWRRIAIPGAFTLDRVHRAIQIAVGWQDCHLHSFEIGSVQYGEPDPDALLEMRDELDVRLDAVVGKDGRFTYVYDFGDWWEHEVVVETVSLAEPDERYPFCLEGERACPPEDVGGPGGYAEFTRAIRDTGHPEHDAMVDWIGRRFDPEFFDPERVSVLLRRLA